MTDDKTIKLSANAARLLGTDQPQVLWGREALVRARRSRFAWRFGSSARRSPVFAFSWSGRRISLNNSVLETLETEVLGQGHPACTPIRARNSRASYFWPESKRVVTDAYGTYTYEGKSQIDLGGMDNPDRFMSTQYDVIAFVEATEGFRAAWGKLSTRNRRYRHALRSPVVAPDCRLQPSGQASLAQPSRRGGPGAR